VSSGKFNDGVGVVHGHTVVDEQGVQEGTKHAALRGPCFESQSGRYVVAYPHHLGAACQEVQDPVEREMFSPGVLSLVMSLEGTMVLNAKL
jgi:hypothetical protein